jgi:antitoxin (DNA-binding transcriptional repressor) of toxin-antitoxin stability system
MKSVKIGELKTHLSRYLQMVRRGEQIRVLDRDEPIAIIAPTKPPIGEYLARMAAQGRVTLGTQDFSTWKKLRRPKLKRRLTDADIVEELRAIGGD